MSEQQFWNELPEVIKVIPKTNEYYYDRREGMVCGFWASEYFEEDTINKLPLLYKKRLNFYKEKYSAYSFQLFMSFSAPDDYLYKPIKTEPLGIGWHFDDTPGIIATLYGKPVYKLFSDDCIPIRLNYKETIYFDTSTKHIGLSDITPRIIVSMATDKPIDIGDVTHHYKSYIQYDKKLYK
jgi:hypothetical protein